jgi:hypothetical protein
VIKYETMAKKQGTAAAEAQRIAERESAMAAVRA